MSADMQHRVVRSSVETGLFWPWRFRQETITSGTWYFTQGGNRDYVSQCFAPNNQRFGLAVLHIIFTCEEATISECYSRGRSRKMASDSEKFPSVLNHTVTSTGSPTVTLQQGSISSRVSQNVVGRSSSASV